MRVDPDIAGPLVPPSLAPPPSRPALASVPSPRPVPGPAPVAMAQDRIVEPGSKQSDETNVVSALATWANSEWSTLASAAHGLASAPGIVSNAWHAAAKTNLDLARSVNTTTDHWADSSASERQVAIDGLKKAASVSTTASAAANELSRANRLPLMFEKAINAAIAVVPPDRQSALRDSARIGSTAINHLSASTELRSRAAVHVLETAASAQRAKASTPFATVSKIIGMTAAGLHDDFKENAATRAVPKGIQILRDIPLGGALLNGIAVGTDLQSGKSIADASLANIAGTLVGTVAGDAVADGLASFVGGAAIADETAVALGAAAATGPVGWALAGGVIIGAVAGYGVYKLVESTPGQDLVDGLTQLDRPKIGRGLAAVESIVSNGAVDAGNWVADHAKVVHE